MSFCWISSSIYGILGFMPLQKSIKSVLTLPDVDHNTPLGSLTTMRVGGSARYFIRAATEEHLIKAVRSAERVGLKWVIIGEGSNIIPPDRLLDSLVIKNEINHLRQKESRVTVGGGANLLKFIKSLNALGSAGFEKMAGIPGTVGGAVYGCAGAYGQEIKDHLVRVKIYDGSPKQGMDAVRWLSRKECRFGYRTSIFKKKKGRVILEAEFEVLPGTARALKKISRDIIQLRKQKYRPGLRCPGSFFKNILLADIKPLKRRQAFLDKVPANMIQYGKVPAGYLLESVGAKGMREGGIAVAEHHGNLIYNTGHGTAREIKKLAEILKAKVKKTFGILLEEEVRYL
jgi:UDP-N-acetylmuramate dehydrogenase